VSSGELEIKHTSRVIYAVLEDGSKAYVKYEVEGNVMKLLETYTPPQHRGRGVARKLIEYALKLAAENNWLVEPICSYALSYFVKNPDKRVMLTPQYRSMSDAELQALFEKRLEEERARNKQ